jgi:hypothetical protein
MLSTHDTPSRDSAADAAIALRASVVGAVRISLDGSPAGIVSSEEAASGYLLALRERQCQPRAAPWRRTTGTSARSSRRQDRSESI